MSALIESKKIEEISPQKPASHKKSASPLNRDDKLWGRLFILPPFIGILLFVLAPIVFTVILSFSDWSGTENIFRVRFTDPLFRNFGELFKSVDFWKSVTNTIVYMIGIPIGITISLLVAIGLNRKIFLAEAFKVIYYIPVIASVVAVALLFQRLYTVDGPLNKLITAFGFDPIYWSSSGGKMRASIIVMMVWKGLGTSVLLFIAGLQGVPSHYFEAAKIDGANAWTIFRKITLPFLYPVLFFIIVTSIIGGAQIFAEPNLIYGTNLETRTVVQYRIYVRAIERSGGVASAMALILGIMIFAVTAFQFWLDRRLNHER